MAQEPQIGKNSSPTKGNHGYFWTHGQNSPADWARELLKPSEDGESLV